MGSKGGLLFDLNEPPIENEDDNDTVVCFQPQKAIPSSSITKTDLIVGSTVPQGIVNNRAFSHSSSASGFQPFLRPKVVQRSNISDESSSVEIDSSFASSSKSSNGQDGQAPLNLQTGCVDVQATEKEEGEWSEAEGSVDIGNVENESASPPRALNSETCEKTGDRTTDGQEDSGPERKVFRGTEAKRALKCANNLGKRPKLDQQKEVMHGKKRARQTIFLDLEDIKQAGPLKTSTPRKQIPPPAITRTVKEAHHALPSADRGDKQSIREPKLGDPSNFEGNNSLDPNDCKSESNGDNRSGSFGPPWRLNSSIDLSLEEHAPLASRQSSRKHPLDKKQLSQFSGRKPAVSSYGSTLAAKKPPSRKQAFVNQYQDSSVERLLREVTNEKFWQHPEEGGLERVPGRFDSVEEYIRVFEPLLFEECRAQLYSNWEESETVSNHVRVGIKSIERRERGWFDVILTPPHDYKLTFKEGDVAVLSYPKPGSVNSRRNCPVGLEDEEKPEVNGRVAGTVRRYIPIDTREHTGAILHFYVGDSYDSSSKNNDDHILRKLHPGGVWYLTFLGSLATTQREYIALHAFRRLNLQGGNQDDLEPSIPDPINIPESTQDIPEQTKEAAAEGEAVHPESAAAEDALQMVVSDTVPHPVPAITELVEVGIQTDEEMVPISKIPVTDLTPVLTRIEGVKKKMEEVLKGVEKKMEEVLTRIEGVKKKMEEGSTSAQLKALEELIQKQFEDQNARLTSIQNELARASEVNALSNFCADKFNTLKGEIKGLKGEIKGLEKVAGEAVERRLVTFGRDLIKRAVEEFGSSLLRRIQNAQGALREDTSVTVNVMQRMQEENLQIAGELRMVCRETTLMDRALGEMLEGYDAKKGEIARVGKPKLPPLEKVSAVEPTIIHRGK